MKTTPPSQLPTFADIRLMNLRLFRTGLLDEAAEKIKQPSESDLKDLETVENTSCPEEVINLCRKVSYYKAKDALVEKILVDQENTMPLLIARFLRSSHDKFIEQATLALGYCDEKYVDEVVDRYEEIRSDYAKAEFCVVLGFREKKECAELLKREAARLKKVSQSSNTAVGRAISTDYQDGPLLALEVMGERE